VRLAVRRSAVGAERPLHEAREQIAQPYGWNYSVGVKAQHSVIVLTGCTRGLGEAMARFFVTEGAVVAGCGRSLEKITKLQKEFGEKHDLSAVDVANTAAVDAWSERVIARLGSPTLLINNAAVIARNAPLWKIPPNEIEAVLSVNLRGTVNVLRAFLPAMIAAKRGVVVNFSSGWGRSTSPDVAIYCTTKWGIEGMTQAIAQDLSGTGVTAVALNPGVINTEMLRECFGPSAAAYPDANDWVSRAGPFLLKLSSKHHGRSLDVPGMTLD
jgi:NAD(P)-dependent dehydrogenase (short-subunit alcohol dehydrogenase family)